VAMAAAAVATMKAAEVAAVVAVVAVEQQRRPRGGRGDGQRATACLFFGSTTPRPRICHTPKHRLGKSYFMFFLFFGSTTPSESPWSPVSLLSGGPRDLILEPLSYTIYVLYTILFLLVILKVKVNFTFRVSGSSY
jgi:hypothetical protein